MSLVAKVGIFLDNSKNVRKNEKRTGGRRSGEKRNKPHNGSDYKEKGSYELNDSKTSEKSDLTTKLKEETNLNHPLEYQIQRQP